VVQRAATIAEMGRGSEEAGGLAAVARQQWRTKVRRNEDNPNQRLPGSMKPNRPLQIQNPEVAKIAGLIWLREVTRSEAVADTSEFIF
jgi:hypothetical protein